MRSSSLVLNTLLVGAGFVLPTWSQTTLHVPADHPTIQAAIEAASPGDTVLVAAGTYVEELDFLSKAITVTSESGAATTILSNVNAAVTFDKFEGPGSVLRGFTVTGNNSSRAAIWAPGASPRIEACVIRDNVSSSAASAVFGNPVLEDCLIENNGSLGGGGAVKGAPTLRRSILRQNQGYDAAALALDGGSVEDCLILDNASGEGSAGSVLVESQASVTFRRCTIARNLNSTTGGQYAAWGAGVTVGALSAPAILVNCTITENTYDVPNLFAPDDVGGVYGPVVLLNTILHGNRGLQYQSGVTTALYSNIEDGLAGTGNIDAAPLFRDAPNGDFRLLPGSPCIDAGSPSSPLDFDESRADMGALAFTHALAATRNGSGTNLPLLTSVTAPVLGTNLQLSVQAALVPQAAFSGITVRAQLLTPGLATPYGELLVGGAKLGLAQQPSNGVADSFSFPIPSNLALLGFEGFAQGYVIRQGPPLDVELGNALRILIGE